MALPNAERQARYRERRKAGESRIRYRRPADREADLRTAPVTLAVTTCGVDDDAVSDSASPSGSTNVCFHRNPALNDTEIPTVRQPPNGR